MKSYKICEQATMASNKSAMAGFIRTISTVVCVTLIPWKQATPSAVTNGTKIKIVAHEIVEYWYATACAEVLLHNVPWQKNKISVLVINVS